MVRLCNLIARRTIVRLFFEFVQARIVQDLLRGMSPRGDRHAADRCQLFPDHRDYRGHPGHDRERRAGADHVRRSAAHVHLDGNHALARAPARHAALTRAMLAPAMKMTGKHDTMALAERRRKALAGNAGVSEKKMMGGICFLLRGPMLGGTAKPGFMFRVGKEQDAEALARPGATTRSFSGARKPGFVWVDPELCDTRALKSWLGFAERYVKTLPPKRQ